MESHDDEPGADSDASLSRRRRGLLKSLLAVPAMAVAAPAAATKTGAAWTQTHDVIVVGSGAAGSAAAIAAARGGARVLVLDKMPFAGGTTAKSDGIFWIPNNPLLRAQGIDDARGDALRYMARLAYPVRYAPEHPTLGLGDNEYALIAAFYDHGSRAIEQLRAAGALQFAQWKDWNGENFTDYHAHLPENKVPQGRSLLAAVPNPGFSGGGNGAELLRQLQAVFPALRIELKLEHRVQRLLLDADGGVSGVEVECEDGIVRLRARKGVIFCSGGFTHNAELCERFLRGHVWGGGAAPGSSGDFIGIATAAGAALGNMSNAWWGQVPVEVALQTRSVPANVWVVPGDSAIQVNRFGLRFANEKALYNERTQAHFGWDAGRDEYPNLLGLMLWDARNARLFGGISPIPAPGSTAAHVIEGDTLDELARRIDERLARLAAHTGGARLDADFTAKLKATVTRYNGFARQGVDADFGRGATPAQLGFHLYGRKKDPSLNPYPNPTMHPLAERGPYYAALIGAGTLDTKGGPIVNAQAQVLDVRGRVIAGLYGAGNCIASPAGQAYWAGGGTIGPALTFGYLAGEHAAARAAAGAKA